MMARPAMLNRFQFARLRAFRKGKKNEADQQGRNPASQSDARQAPPRGDGSRQPFDGADDRNGRDTGGIRDSWHDDDRVTRLLARRAATQEAERRDALERLGTRAPENGDGSGERAPADPGQPAANGSASTTSVDFTTAVPKGRQSDARTTTVPALETPGVAPPPQEARPSNGSVPYGNGSGGTGLSEPPRVDSGMGAATDPMAGVPSASLPEHAQDVDRRTSGWRREGQRGAVASTSARVVCIASGKGGTGKSVLASNLAILRARRGERVLLVDFDAGLANAHLLLGLAPPYDVGHVMEGEVSAHDALVDGPHGMKLLAGGVGRQTMIDPTRRELDRLFKALRALESEFDLILIDHGAGLSYSTVAHLAATSTLILVTNHEVTALSDGYALYKRAHMVNSNLRVGLVVNRAPDERIAMDAWERFRGAAHKFLGHTPELIGWVPADPAIPQAVQMRQPAVLSFPESPAARALKRVAGWPPIDHARTTTAFYDKARRALR